MDEKKYTDGVRESWWHRCQQNSLKAGSKKREAELSAFMHGALAMAVATGVMQQYRCDQIAFLFSVGRAEEFMKWEPSTEEKSNG